MSDDMDKLRNVLSERDMGFMEGFAEAVEELGDNSTVGRAQDHLIETSAHMFEVFMKLVDRLNDAREMLRMAGFIVHGDKGIETGIGMIISDRKQNWEWYQKEKEIRIKLEEELFELKQKYSDLDFEYLMYRKDHEPNNT